MVKAILDSKKTMTRRVIKLQPDKEHFIRKGGPTGRMFCLCDMFGDVETYVKSQYREGDILWVRETFCNVNKPGIEPDYYYFADTLFPECEEYDSKEWTWKPSIFMPRNAARIFLEVKSVRAERLQEIAWEDAKKEGIDPYGVDKDVGGYIKNFVHLWDTINEKRGFSWESNPWVWVIEFRRI
jgi:hypothetical protein